MYFFYSRLLGLISCVKYASSFFLLLLLLRYFHSTIYKLVVKSYIEILQAIHIETEIKYILKRFLQIFEICKAGHFRQELALKTERFERSVIEKNIMGT